MFFSGSHCCRPRQRHHCQPHHHHRGWRQATGWQPSANVRESTDAFYIDMLAPGRNKTDFDIRLDKRLLTVSYEAKEGDDTSDYQYREFGYKSAFKRAFRIPLSVDMDKIDASYENGVLSILLPKREDAQDPPGREVNIS